MARTAEGFKLKRDTRTGTFIVRFTAAGRAYKLSTGENDPHAAEGAAARLYAEAVSGRLVRGPKVATGTHTWPFDEVAALWLVDVQPTVDPTTYELYESTYVGTHFAPFFETMDRLTTVGVQDYIADRLRKVTRETVKKELSVLRRLAEWAHERGYVAELPNIKTPGKRVLGARVDSARKRVFQIFTAAEIAAILRHLPEASRSRKHGGAPYPVRARFVLAWELAFRPETLNQLSAPEDYRRGAVTLSIRDEEDKNRLGRDFPLAQAPAVRASLDSVCPAEGLIFGAHDYRHILRKAAKDAGIDELRAQRISDYDFRHSRLTHLGQVTDNLSGVMYIAGHTQPATTARYLRPQEGRRPGGPDRGRSRLGGCSQALPDTDTQPARTHHPRAIPGTESAGARNAGALHRQRRKGERPGTIGDHRGSRPCARRGNRTPMAVNR
jgi:integrase